MTSQGLNLVFYISKRKCSVKLIVWPFRAGNINKKQRIKRVRME